MTTFRAKARAVELLGKGQIADLPTAISELWKNGYDAYAKNLICSLFLESYKDNRRTIFLLSDDGCGMSKEDIINKWFVLGTDSKARGNKQEPHFGLARRTPMGEKGIGRLSVSYLGSQMLMITKKHNEPANAVLLDWRILENYDFYLSDLNIPVFSFETIKNFSELFAKHKSEFKNNLKPALWPEQKKLRDLIEKEWFDMEVPSFVFDEVLAKYINKESHGTAFIIFTPHDQLIELSEKDKIRFKDDATLNYLRASLSGLHNDLENPQKDFETHFYIHDQSGQYDLIDEFFTQEEMRKADHWLKGQFDETGFFTGEIRIFNEKVKYNYRPTRPPGKTAYGPFSIEWGSVEGEIKNTTLNEEQFRTISEKLDKFGGLYIYRDDFRVLPYGRTEADFLEFEKRRSLGAGYYYFSHRRFIGYISLTRDKNSDLKDKAGREGFVQNKAFREFRDDLKDFFIDIAKRYLRKTPEGEGDTIRQEQLKEISAKHLIQEKAAKKKNQKSKKAFLEQLVENKQVINDLNAKAKELEHAIANEADNLSINYNNYNRLLADLQETKNQLRSLRLQKPKGVTISNKQENEYIAYQKEFVKTEEIVKVCERTVEDSRKKINVENLKLEFNEKFNTHLRNLDKLFSSFQGQVKSSVSRVQQQLNEEKDTQINSFIERTASNRLEPTDTKETISLKTEALQSQIDEQLDNIDSSIGGFISHVNNLQIDVDDDYLRGWYQEQRDKLERKLEDYEELAQLGMSIEIIDHQFNVMYSQMNDAVAEFDKYSRKYPEMEYSFRQLKSAFQHLEGNYKLLKPLYRTSRRTREVITGAQIEKYIREFFSNEFQRYRIDFSVSDEFRAYEFFTYDSIIKPVFLNLINNANYWLIPVDNRRIRIEHFDGRILVMNSGERIDDSYLEDIFTLFFTRKRDGRGIGLYLAKRNLSAIGYDIYATNEKEFNKLKGACFIIIKSNTDNEYL